MPSATAPATTSSTRRAASGTSRPATRASPRWWPAACCGPSAITSRSSTYVPEWKLKNGPVPRPFGGTLPLEFRPRRDWRLVVERQPVQGHARVEGPDSRQPADQQLGPEAEQQPDRHRCQGPAGAERWFVAQDLGASFGKTGMAGRQPQQRRGLRDARTSWSASRTAASSSTTRRVTANCSRTSRRPTWCGSRELFARITDRQLADAFRAAAMPDETSTRYIRKLKSKIQEGLSLRSNTVVRR